MFKTAIGDVFTSGAEAIAHGVNTRGIMGAGIAVEFREIEPEMYEAYRNLCDEFGHSLAGLILPWKSSYEHRTYYNLFTQIYPGANADYALLESSALAMRIHAEQNGIRTVALPEIGCGIGGLEYHNVKAILKSVLWSSSVDFVMYTYPANVVPEESVTKSTIPKPSAVFGKER